MSQNPELIDRIYECFLVPDQWPSVLHELTLVAGARTGFLLVTTGDTQNAISSNDAGTGTILPLLRSGWLVRSDRYRRGMAYKHAGFFRDHDVYADQELVADPFYRDILYQRGLGWSAFTAVPLPTGDCFSIVLEKEYRLGPVETSAIRALDRLRPHLARSALLAARLQLDRAGVATETLAAIGLPAVVLAANGKVLAANALIEAMDKYVVWGAHGLLSMRDRGASQLLRTAIEKAENPRSICSFPVHDANFQELMVAHVIPIRRAARDIFVRAAAVLVLTPVKLPQAPPVELVRSLFDLTPAEARVARSLASGLTVDDIASAGGISANTVRTHVRGVLMKTGRSRQTEVVALLNGIWSPRLA